MKNLVFYFLVVVCLSLISSSVFPCESSKPKEQDGKMTTFKRPMTEEELGKMISWIERLVPKVMMQEDDSARCRLIRVMPRLWADVTSVFNQRPMLSPEEMKMMGEQRVELMRKSREEYERRMHEHYTGEKIHPEFDVEDPK